MEIIVIILLLVVVGVLGFMLFNLLRKLEIYEDWIGELKSDLATTIDNMKNIDEIGAFEADDETGEVFKSLLSLVNGLNRYT